MATTSAKAKRSTVRKAPARKAAARKAPRKASKKRSAADKRGVGSAARKAAELFGMDPKEVEATADKLRDQTSKAGQRIKEEMGKLGQRADELSTRFDAQVKQGVQRVEQVADEVAKGLGIKPDELATKMEQNLDRWSREAQKVAEEANVEIKKMYEQARERLKLILKK